jgi:hypothetical protein
MGRIRRFLKARELFGKKNAGWGRPLRADNLEYKSVLMKDCFKYVTLFNLLLAAFPYVGRSSKQPERKCKSTV